jgi:hypothetical protein
MTVEHLEILVEEPSMEAALRALLPRIVGGLSFEIHPHQGKQDLLGSLRARLFGYAAWAPSTWRIVVIVDRDEEDCHDLKARLDQMVDAAGLVSRSRARSKPYMVITRLAVEELEAWYFGDWAAVRAAYPRVPVTIPSQQKYRNPDAIAAGTWEALERILQKAGYFTLGLAKIEAARTIAAHMVPERNTSRSFQVLREALAELAT